MVVIYDIHNNYDENEVSLGNPGKIHGGSGSYYTKIFINKELFYFKINNCTTKNGILQTEKKIYTDIMFSLLNNDVQYVEWFHQLENVLIDLIYSKSSSWFLSELDKEEINEYFNPVLRQYKTNNNLLRLQLNNKKNIPECIIFDENEEIKSYDDVYGKHFDCIVHIKGIRFTSTSFQLDLELKQILLLEENDVFSSCILRDNSRKSHQYKPKEHEQQQQEMINDTISINIEKDHDDNDNVHNNHGNEHEDEKEHEHEHEDEELQKDEEYKDKKLNLLLLSNGEEYIEENDNKHENKDEDENENTLNDDFQENIKEYNLDCNMDNTNSVQIREPTDVYKELYEKMIQKAMTAKQDYLNAYKQAQFIKKEYLGIYEDDDDDIETKVNNQEYDLKI